LSRIIKSVSLRDVPLIIEHNPPAPAPPPDDFAPADDEICAAGPGPDDETPPAAEAEQDDAAAVAAREEEEAALAAAAALREEARRQGYEDGFKEGYAEGLVRGEAAGLAQAGGRIEEAAHRAQNIIALAQEQATQGLLNAERQLLDLAVAIARRILGQEIARDQTAVLPIVQAALTKVRDQEQITVRVNPENYEAVLAARLQLQASLTRDNALTVAADSSLAQGDCVLETPYGKVDARIDTQLELVKTALKELIP